jgi:hypothetical protein
VGECQAVRSSSTRYSVNHHPFPARETHLLSLFSVIIISSLRLYLVVKGQWLADGSWFYCPMLAIENAEIGGTLIALSIPGLKPLLAQCSPYPGTYSRSAPQSDVNLPPLSPLGASRTSIAEVIAPETTISTGAGNLRKHASNDSWLELGRGNKYASYEVKVESRSVLTHELPRVPTNSERVSSWGDWPLDSRTAL